jgi:hypothetical protein
MVTWKQDVEKPKEIPRIKNFRYEISALFQSIFKVRPSPYRGGNWRKCIQVPERLSCEAKKIIFILLPDVGDFLAQVGFL